jgi:hypothetical protein
MVLPVIADGTRVEELSSSITKAASSVGIFKHILSSINSVNVKKVIKLSKKRNIGLVAWIYLFLLGKLSCLVGVLCRKANQSSIRV